MSDDRIPASPETERAMIAAMLMEPRAIQHAVNLSPSAFWVPRYRVLFLAAAKCYARRQQLDPLLVLEQLRDDGELDLAGGVDELARLTDPTGYSFQHGHHYAEILRGYEAKRAGIVEAEKLRAIAQSHDSAAILSALRDAVRRFERAAESETLRLVDLIGPFRSGLPPVPWIAEGWFGEGDSIVLAGEWATGKSIVALDLAFAIALGRKWLRHIVIAKRGSVIYCDEENNARNVQRRAVRMLRSEGWTDADVETMPVKIASKNGLRLDRANPKRTAFLRLVDEMQPALIVLDTMKRFHRGDANKESDIAGFFAEAITPLTARGIAVLMLDHLRKPTKDDGKYDAAHRVSGTHEKIDYGDNSWTLEGDRNTDARSLSCSKNRWEDSRPAPMTTKWCVSDDEEEAWLEASDGSLSAELAIKDVLRATTGLRTKDLLEAVQGRGVPLSTARKAVKRATESGALRRVDLGGRRVVYELA